MALRIGLFYTATLISGAIGGPYSLLLSLMPPNEITGFLARGLSAIGPRGGLEGWRWIFIIEGLLVSLINQQHKLDVTY
jgi:hypothetical protein